jgi:hypothetical protein
MGGDGVCAPGIPMYVREAGTHMETRPPAVEAVSREATRLGFSPTRNAHLRILLKELQEGAPSAFGWVVYDGDRQLLLSGQNTSIEEVVPIAKIWATWADAVYSWYEQGVLERVAPRVFFEQLYRIFLERDPLWAAGDADYHAFVRERVATLSSLFKDEGT